jgi:cytosine/creatinine deaminase
MPSGWRPVPSGRAAAAPRPLASEAAAHSGSPDGRLDLRLTACRLVGRLDLVDLGVRAGRIVSAGDLDRVPAARTLPVDGRLVVPGFIDAHVHVDKAYLLDRAPSREGTLAEAIKVTSLAKRGFTVTDVEARARAVLDRAVACGTTAMRGHVEVDHLVGLTGVEALLPLRDEYRDRLDLQLCAFAQEGIVQAPGTEALLGDALRAGMDLVGGCPYTDVDPLAHIDAVFRLAGEFDVDADFHVDFADEPERLHVQAVAERTISYGWQGRVAVGHVTELAACEPAEQDRLIALIRAAGLAVVTLPATDLYLMGRQDARNVRRGLAPVKRLLAAGVPVAAATNNVQNAFTPVGNADPLLLAYLLAVSAHMGTEAEMGQVLDMLTRWPARLVYGPAATEHGLDVGCRADLVVLEARTLAEAVGAVPARRWVVKAGRVIVDRSRPELDTGGTRL